MILATCEALSRNLLRRSAIEIKTKETWGAGQGGCLRSRGLATSSFITSKGPIQPINGVAVRIWDSSFDSERQFIIVVSTFSNDIQSLHSASDWQIGENYEIMSPEGALRLAPPSTL